MRPPRHCELREGQASEILAGIEGVGTVLVGVLVRAPNCLQVNRKIVRAFAGITSDLEKTHGSATHRARRETIGPVVSSDQRDWPMSRSPALHH